MKQPKKATRNQKELMKKNGYDPQEWMVARELPNTIIIQRKGSKEQKVIEK